MGGESEKIAVDREGKGQNGPVVEWTTNGRQVVQRLAPTTIPNDYRGVL